MIAVQMVTRVINDLADRKPGVTADFGGEFADDQREWPGRPSVWKEPDQSHYERFYLVPPKFDEEEGDEGDDDEDED